MSTALWMWEPRSGSVFHFQERRNLKLPLAFKKQKPVYTSHAVAEGAFLVWEYTTPSRVSYKKL
jgi:hypothetical protein